MCAHTNTNTHPRAHLRACLLCCLKWAEIFHFGGFFHSVQFRCVCLLFAPCCPLSPSVFYSVVLRSTSVLLLLFYFLDLSIYLCIIFHSAAPEFKVANMDGYVCMCACVYVYADGWMDGWMDVCAVVYAVSLFCLISFSFLCVFYQ